MSRPERPKLSNYRLGDRAFPYVMLALPAVMVAALIAYPMFVVLNMSVREGRQMQIDRVSTQPLSLSNFRDVLSDIATWESFGVTFVYTVGSTAGGFAVGLAAALILNQNFPGRRIFRTLVLVPWAVPGVAASAVFMFMLDGSHGIVNSVLNDLGVIDSRPPWYFQPSTALLAVIVPTVWKGFPFFAILFVAALQTIPAEMYEAASLDGASKLERFRYITWPGLRSAAVLGLILQGLWAFHVFDIIYPLTRGGPNGATETWAIRIYNQAFSFFQPGTASALGVVATIAAAGVVIALFPALRKEFF